jgi:hypothetical protein
MRVDAKGYKLDGDYVSEIVCDAMIITKGDRVGEVSVEFSEDFITCDAEGVLNMIDGLNTAIKLGWLEPTVKGVK